MHHTLFLGVTLPTHSMLSAVYRCGIPTASCSTPCALARCFCSCFLAVFSCCFFPFPLYVYSTTLFHRPFLWVSPFPIVTGVGLWQQWMLWCRSSLDPPARLCSGKLRSGVSLALSPLLPGRLHAHSASFLSHSHSRSFTA